MTLVVLDIVPLDGGDLDLAALKALGEVTLYPTITANALCERHPEATHLLTNKVPITPDLLAGLPHVRYIGVLATGYNVVDLAACRNRGIVVTNVPEYGTAAVAQHTMALLLALTNHVAAHHADVAAGGWSRRSWSYWLADLVDLSGKTLGLLGVGRIGTAVARLGEALGMRVIAHSRSGGGVLEQVSLEELFAQADVLSLHCPLTEATRAIVNAERLALMKPTALLINTGRGGLIDENALAEALHSGRLAGAGLDVLGQEPPPPDHPLLHAPRVLITPHIAWSSRASRQRLLDVAVENVRAFESGAPCNVVSTPGRVG